MGIYRKYKFLREFGKLPTPDSPFGNRRKNYRQIKKRLFNELNGKCENCKIPLYLVPSGNNIQKGFKNIDIVATIEHVYNRWDIRRGLDGEIVKLFCHKCNQDNEHTELNKLYEFYDSIYNIEIINLIELLNK